MPKSPRSRPRYAIRRDVNVQDYPTAKARPKPLSDVLYNLSKGVITHQILNTAENVSLEYRVKDEIEIKNEPPRERCDQSPTVSSEYVDPRITRTEIYEEQNADFQPLFPEQFQVPANTAYFGYQDVQGQQVYAPLKYMQVGNVVVQVLDPETQYYLLNAAQNISSDYSTQEQAVIKEVPRKKVNQTRKHSVDGCEGATSQHWADFYVTEADNCVEENTCQEEETSNDANKFIIGQDDNEVNVHIITKDGKETTIINTFREVEQRPNKAGTHGENENCACKICEGKKKSYVSAFEQFLSQMGKKKVEPELLCKKVKTENCKTEKYSSY